MRTARKRAGKGKRKIATVMREYKRGTLKSGSGRKVTSRLAGGRHRHERGPARQPQAQKAAMTVVNPNERRIGRHKTRVRKGRGQPRVNAKIHVLALAVCLLAGCAKPRSQMEIPEPP